MTTEFNSFGEFALQLAKIETAEVMALQAGLKRVAQVIEKTAKSEIGHYQPSVGPFQDWAPLAESTEQDKARLGYLLDAPLLRTGEMRDSISHEVSGLEAVIGSPEEKLVWQEFGTKTIPPRPVLGPAAFRNKELIHKIVGAAAVSGLIGAQRVHAALGYDFESTKD